jgi:hypothetical protein
MNDVNPKYDPSYEDMTPAAHLCSEKRCAEYRDELECRVQGIQAKVREQLLQISELKDKIAAEAMRAKMLDTVHRVALNQNTAMLELAEHYTGTLWPEEVNRAAAEILKAAEMAKNEKRKCEGCVDDQHRGTECKCCHMIYHCCSHHCCCFYRCKDCRHAESEHEKGPCGFGGACNCRAYNGERR